MNSRTKQILAALLAVLVLIITVAPMAAAASGGLTPPPMPPSLPTLNHDPTSTPTPVPTPIVQPSGDSSDGGTSTLSSASGFQPYTIDLKSTDGTVIGNITAVTPALAKLWAEKVIVIGGKGYTVRMTADLESVPASPMLDIIAATPDIGHQINLDDYFGIAAFNITRYSTGSAWVMKPGTVHLYIVAPAEALTGVDPAAPLYVVKSEARQHIVYDTTLTGDDDSTTVDTVLQYDPQASATTGTYTLTGKKALESVLTTATPTPAADTTTAHVGTGYESNPLLLAGVLLFGVIIGLAGMLLLTTRMRR